MIQILGPVLSFAGSFLKHWSETRSAKHKANLTRIESEGKVAQINAQHGATWEVIWAKHSTKSWMDDAWSATFIGIIWGVIFPPTRADVLEGLEALHALPVWLQGCVIASVAASFGLRQLFARWMGK